MVSSRETGKLHLAVSDQSSAVIVITVVSPEDGDELR